MAALLLAMAACQASAEKLAPQAEGGFAPLISAQADNVTLKPNTPQVTASPAMTGLGTGVAVQLAAGDEGYPGVQILPKGAESWDLSKFGYVEAKVINTGERAINLSLRVDNAGDWQKNPFNTESRTIKPGESGTIKVIFGYAYGYKKGYALDPSSVPQVMLFTGKLKEPRSILIESLRAGGEPGEKPLVDPKDVRVAPKDGFLLGKGINAEKDLQIDAGKGTTSVTDGTVQITVPAGAKEPSVAIKPAAGRWDLRQVLVVKVQIKNVGSSPITPRLLIDSNGGPTEWASAQGPIAPGEAGQVEVSFLDYKPWQGPEVLKGTHIPGSYAGQRLTSDSVSAVRLGFDQAEQERKFVIESITTATPVADMPEWVGKRPPVEGDWKLTLEDNFDDTGVNKKLWNIYTANYWDSRTHFSKDNVILGNGLAKLRYEKKTGFVNDDPEQLLPKTKKNSSDYACGYLDTYGNWVQRYGYFESRMKLPEAPGLWPAFWLMPDRGAEVGPQWKRADTKNGGMEFDILEHLTRWGPHRWNIAFHWDGYDKDHKATGSSNIYAAKDKDGFVTCGLLWLPGEAKFYVNGRLVAEWTNERISNVQSYVIFYMVSGGWDNSALDDSKLPADLEIDYVRVWQRADLASDVDGWKSK